MKDLDFKKIKLIIWDLDETLWDGILSEGNVVLSKEMISLIIDLSKRGIVNSICSKNNYEDVFKLLEKYGLDYYFVFPSINWLAKGQRIQNIISNCQLRDENVLFIDDNDLNLNEASFYCPNIMTAKPDICDSLKKCVFQIGKDDSKLSRLKQYKLLETKHKDQSTYDSNEEFLKSCNIRVDILENPIDEIDRLSELILRTNQLNFTKIRCEKGELLQEIQTSYRSGYVVVNDNYGEYGVCGFFLLDRPDHLKHFLFSCRTIGMGIEEYVYNFLGKPSISIIPPVSNENLINNPFPNWINNNSNTNNSIAKAIKKSVLFKGPCDFLGIASYLKIDDLITEFTYTNDNGEVIETQNHIVNILNSKLSHSCKEALLSYNVMMDEGILRSEIYKKSFDVVILSMLPNFNFGVYVHKKTGLRIALGQDAWDLTDQSTWDKYINGVFFNGGMKLSKSDLIRFSEDFVKIKYDSKTMIEDINKLVNDLPGCYFVLALGFEKDLVPNQDDNWKNRGCRHKEFNDMLKRSQLANNSRVVLLDVNDFAKDRSDFRDSINHYTKRIFYLMSKRLNSILLDLNVKSKTKNPFVVFLKKVFRRIKLAFAKKQ